MLIFSVRSTVFQFVMGGVMAVLASLLALLNQWGPHFVGVPYVHHGMTFWLPVMFLLALVSFSVRHEAGRVFLFFMTLFKVCLLGVLLQFICYAIQFTPFELIDPILYRIDLWLGYHPAQWLAWLRLHPNMFAVVSLIYHSLNVELIAIPLVLALCLQAKDIDVFILACLISFFIGASFYYFFPTTDPASVVVSDAFLTPQRDVVQQFFGVHGLIDHYAKVKSLIGFPSFHVIWSILLIYSARHVSCLFFPLLIWNLIIIASTLLLGWHFLSSDLGAIVIALISIILARRVT